MDPVIIELLAGIFAGTLAGVLIVKRAGDRPPEVALSAVKTTRRSLSGPRKRSRNVGPRKLRVRKSRTDHASAEVKGNATESKVLAQPAFQSCLTCGLEAPETVLAEHFIVSPSHTNDPAKVQPILAETTLEEQTSRMISEEDSRDSVRKLLQMLVPPRAFGRRHQQRSVNPFAGLVQTIGPSRHEAGP